MFGRLFGNRSRIRFRRRSPQRSPSPKGRPPISSRNPAGSPRRKRYAKHSAASKRNMALKRSMSQKRKKTFSKAPRQSGYIPKSRGGTRKLNEYFRTMLRAKRAGAPSFQYKGKTYYRGTKINRKNGVEFVFYSRKQKGKSRSRSRSRSPSR